MSNSRVCHFKLVLLGDTAVGKSCLVVRFVRDEFFEFQEPTIGGKLHVSSGLPARPDRRVSPSASTNDTYQNLHTFYGIQIVPVSTTTTESTCFRLVSIPFHSIPIQSNTLDNDSPSVRILAHLILQLPF